MGKTVLKTFSLRPEVFEKLQTLVKRSSVRTDMSKLITELIEREYTRKTKAPEAA